MAANFLLGRQAKAYYSTTLLNGTNTSTILTNTATYTEVANIMDLALEIDSEFVDVTTRGEAANGFRSEVPTLKNGRITFEARWKPGDAFTDALIDAWNGTAGTGNDSFEMAFFAFDQPTTISSTSSYQGLAGNFAVSLSKTENLTDIQKLNVTLTVSSYPEWVKRAGLTI